MLQAGQTGTGTVKRYDTEKGYGFISPTVDGESKDLFFHFSAKVDQSWQPREGDVVTFTVGQNEKGFNASNVALEGAESDTDSATDEVSEEEMPMAE